MSKQYEQAIILNVNIILVLLNKVSRQNRLQASTLLEM